MQPTTLGYYPTNKPFPIDLDLHTWMIGQSGTGKSTAMTNAFIELMQRGEGGTFIDPHGPASDKLLHYVPRPRLQDIILIDLSQPFQPGIIAQFKSPRDAQLYIQGNVSMVKKLHANAWGDESERVTTGAFDATTEHYGFINYPAAYLFVARQKFREMILSKTTNPLLIDFREQYDEKLRSSEQMAKFSPPLNKLAPLVRTVMRAVISRDKPLDWRRVMDDKRIVIVRLPKGEIGEDVASLVGSIIVLNIKIAALGRKESDPKHHLFIDECQNFLGSVDFETFASEMRKYNVPLFLATQYLEHFPYLAALFGNFPNAIVYRVSGTDAQTIEENYYSPGLANQIVNLPNYHFIARFIDDHMPKGTRSMIRSRKNAKKDGTEPPYKLVVNESIRRWGADVQKAEEKINKFLAYSA